MKMSIQEISAVSMQPLKVQSDVVKSNLPQFVKEARQPSSEEIKTSVSQINESLNKNKVDINMSVDSKTAIPVITVTNTLSGDIIMQFPSKVVLAIAEAIDTKQAGVLIKDKA
jgi:uncharacterized FlaG/YvyC family protein